MLQYQTVFVKNRLVDDHMFTVGAYYVEEKRREGTKMFMMSIGLKKAFCTRNPGKQKGPPLPNQ